MHDPLAAALPLEDDLRHALERDNGDRIIDQSLREADLRGELQWGQQEQRRHDRITGYSCLISVATASESQSYSLVVATNGQCIAHITLNRLFSHLTAHLHPAVDALARWNLVKSVQRKVRFYGLLPSVSFGPQRASFHIARSVWERFSDQERDVAIARLRRLADEHRAVSLDLSGRGGLEILGQDDPVGNDSSMQRDDRDLGQMISDAYLGRRILYEE